MFVAGNRDYTARVGFGLVVCLALLGERSSLSAAETDLGRRTYSTENFVIRARGSAVELESLGRRCEALRSELRAKWFEQDAAVGAWSPRCIVVVHDDASSYSRAVPGGERTVGSSWIEFERDRVVTRQIDVRGDRDDWFEGTMPHELTHVLSADRFITVPMPRWAEEGLALLADPQHKQVLHDLDFRHSVAGQRQFRLVELLATEGYPPAERQLTFYGQSASLVRYLAARGQPVEFIAFVERAGVEGYDAALRKTYGIDGVAALESDWLRSVHNAELAVAK